MSTTKNPYNEKTQQSREDQLVTHAPLVKRVVTRMAARFPPGVDHDELYQVGMIGLLDAVDKFDPTRDVKFKTYAEFRIKGAILDELRSMDWVPRSVRSATNEWGKAWRSQTFEYGREPSDQEMADHLEMNLEEYHEFILKASPTPLISIEEFKAHSNQEDSVSLLEILAKPGEKDPFILLSMQQMKNKLADAVSELDEREQLILSLYFQEEMNLKEIGEILGIIESRVSQIRTKTILKLRAKLRLMTRDGMEDQLSAKSEMPNDKSSITQLLEEMVEHQKTKVLKVAREIIPDATPEDIRNPQDFPELSADSLFNYEDGILTGYLSMQTALRNRNKA